MPLVYVQQVPICIIFDVAVWSQDIPGGMKNNGVSRSDRLRCSEPAILVILVRVSVSAVPVSGSGDRRTNDIAIFEVAVGISIAQFFREYPLAILKR